MITNRIRISKESTDKMKQLKMRLKTGSIYPVARMSLALSLQDKRPPQEDFYKEDGMEFNRLTLLGQYDPVYICMLKERGFYKKPRKGIRSQKVETLSSKEATSYMVAHINRGVIKLHARVKNQEDLLLLVQEQNI